MGIFQDWQEKKGLLAKKTKKYRIRKAKKTRSKHRKYEVVRDGEIIAVGQTKKDAEKELRQWKKYDKENEC